MNPVGWFKFKNLPDNFDIELIPHSLSVLKSTMEI